jgi:hypothetical protein
MERLLAALVGYGAAYHITANPDHYMTLEQLRPYRQKMELFRSVVEQELNLIVDDRVESALKARGL